MEANRARLVAQPIIALEKNQNYKTAVVVVFFVSFLLWLAILLFFKRSCNERVRVFAIYKSN